jgi:hypothetical protein
VSDECARLEALISELVVFVAQEVRFGLSLGPLPLAHEADGCDDCTAFQEALVWHARLASGELGPAGVKAASDLETFLPASPSS